MKLTARLQLQLQTPLLLINQPAPPQPPPLEMANLPLLVITTIAHLMTATAAHVAEATEVVAAHDHGTDIESHHGSEEGARGIGGIHDHSGAGTHPAEAAGEKRFVQSLLLNRRFVDTRKILCQLKTCQPGENGLRS